MNITRVENTRLPACLNELLFGEHVDWQMTAMERALFIRLLDKIKPEVAIEVGTYKGGSLAQMSKYSKKVYSLDINESYIRDLRPRFPNAEFILGNCAATLPALIAKLQREGPPVEFALIDASHEAHDVRRDIENMIRYVPKKPLWILMHDSFMPSCRAGILTADWSSSPYVHAVHLDFVPGAFNCEPGAPMNMTCGLALALMLPSRRTGDVLWCDEGQIPHGIIKRHSVHHKSHVVKARELAGRVKRKVRKLVHL